MRRPMKDVCYYTVAVGPSPRLIEIFSGSEGFSAYQARVAELSVAESCEPDNERGSLGAIMWH